MMTKDTNRVRQSIDRLTHSAQSVIDKMHRKPVNLNIVYPPLIEFV